MKKLYFPTKAAFKRAANIIKKISKVERLKSGDKSYLFERLKEKK